MGEDNVVLSSKIKIGVSVMEKKTLSAPMRQILESLEAFGEFEIITFATKLFSSNQWKVISDNADQESLVKATLSGVKAVPLKPLYPHVMCSETCGSTFCGTGSLNSGREIPMAKLPSQRLKKALPVSRRRLRLNLCHHLRNGRRGSSGRRI
ncbi:uncharacterized protein LOC116267168 [Nymphaea colorata]|nr:uncharacterized protein LOC116267168 [Nymphaea colorata]